MLPISLYVSFEFYRRHHHQDAATKRTKKFKRASIKSFARGVFHPWKKSKSFSCRPIHVDHLLHHVHPATDAVDEGNHKIEAGPQHSRIAAEALDGPVIALRHRLDAEEDREDR